jgi:hypothetical protein
MPGLQCSYIIYMLCSRTKSAETIHTGGTTHDICPCSLQVWLVSRRPMTANGRPRTCMQLGRIEPRLVELRIHPLFWFFLRAQVSDAKVRSPAHCGTVTVPCTAHNIYPVANGQVWAIHCSCNQLECRVINSWTDRNHPHLSFDGNSSIPCMMLAPTSAFLLRLWSVTQHREFAQIGDQKSLRRIENVSRAIRFDFITSILGSSKPIQITIQSYPDETALKSRIRSSSSRHI